jgi:hypothetical protein
MARAVATNFERDAINVCSNASLPMTSARVSARLWAWSLDDSLEAGRALLFLVLKTGNGLLIAAAALVCPTKLAVLDV